jgi:hypothetical protein
MMRQNTSGIAVPTEHRTQARRSDEDCPKRAAFIREYLAGKQKMQHPPAVRVSEDGRVG